MAHSHLSIQHCAPDCRSIRERNGTVPTIIEQQSVILPSLYSAIIAIPSCNSVQSNNKGVSVILYRRACRNLSHTLPLGKSSKSIVQTAALQRCVLPALIYLCIYQSSGEKCHKRDSPASAPKSRPSKIIILIRGVVWQNFPTPFVKR